jgi:hypothetical protein
MKWTPALDAALDVWDQNNYLSISDIEETVPSHFMSPEDLLVRAEEDLGRQIIDWRLSEEAKQVLGLILDCPKEMFEIIGSPRRKMVSLSRLRIYLTKQFEGKDEANKILDEIRGFVRVL